MRDILLGSLTYWLVIASVVGEIVFCFWLFGPPTADRSRVAMFVVGGGMITVATVFVLISGAVIYDLATRAH